LSHLHWQVCLDSLLVYAEPHRRCPISLADDSLCPSETIMPVLRSSFSIPGLSLLLLFSAQILLSYELHHRVQQSKTPSQNEDLVAHEKLSPPLRVSSELRFSPDGRYLLFQNASGLMVLSREPLQLMFYISASGSYAARFSNDSQTVSLLTRELVFSTWRLSDGERINSRQLNIQSGCLDAQLAPGTEWIACLSTTMTLDLYRSSDMTRAYTQRISAGRSPTALVSIPLHLDSPFAGPFGFMLSSDLAPLADRGLFHLPLLFSPDGKFLLVTSEDYSCRLDLPALQKSSLPGTVHKRMSEMLAIQPDNRVLVAGAKKESPPALISLDTGNVVSTQSFEADAVSIATNPQYARLSKIDVTGVSLFDLRSNKTVDIPANLAADVHSDTLALVSCNGLLQFYRLHEPALVRQVRLPLDALPTMYAALADPSLSTLAVAIKGGGAVFDLGTGKRLATFNTFSGATFSSAQDALFLLPARFKAPARVIQWSAPNAAETNHDVWTANSSTQIVPEQHSFIEYSRPPESTRSPYRTPEFEIPALPFLLRGLDPASGRELWKHSYSKDPPTPFNDPQGGLLVLGWNARSESAREEAKRFPAARSALKELKIKEHDSFFEVLDARTGSPLGGVLVQFGSGPNSFDSAFACGDSLFLVKDQFRVTVFHLADGRLLARLRGSRPATSAEAKLFVLDEDGEKLVFYDLATGVRLAERRFSDGIAYSRFSEKGDRIFVLTAHQEALVLDVKKILQASGSPASSNQ